MNKLTSLALLLCLVGLVSSRSKDSILEDSGDLKAEESRQRIYDIIQSHEGRKYGDHGGHEYEEGEAPLKLASRKRYGYLPLPVEGKSPVYYEAAPKPKDKVYRENVAAYAAKSVPVHLANPSHHVITSPVRQSHYAVVDPKVHNQHYTVVDPKIHNERYEVVDPKGHNQYVVFDDPKPHRKQPLILDPKLQGTYILEEEPHYVVPDHEVVVNQPVISHTSHYQHPVKDYSHYDHHVEDKGHQASGHGYHGDNSVHGESGHKAHKNYEVAGHKAHSTNVGHHDEHDRHHNRAHYERDRGYHYEKAYAYDRVRAHHDIGSDKGSHSDYHSHHGQEGHKEAGDHGSQSYMYFKKNDQHGAHGHHGKTNSLYKGGHRGGQGYHDYELKYLPPHHHAYGK